MTLARSFCIAAGCRDRDPSRDRMAWGAAGRSTGSRYSSTRSLVTRRSSKNTCRRLTSDEQAADGQPVEQCGHRRGAQGPDHPRPILLLQVEPGGVHEHQPLARRAGLSAATATATPPPMLLPTRVARETPSRSSKPRTTAGYSSKERSGGQSDCPNPGRSRATTSWSRARTGRTSFQVESEDANPCRRTIAGPDPLRTNRTRRPATDSNRGRGPRRREPSSGRPERALTGRARRVAPQQGRRGEDGEAAFRRALTFRPRSVVGARATPP